MKKPGCIPTVFECWKDLKHIYKTPKNRPSNKLQRNRERLSQSDLETVESDNGVCEISESETLQDGLTVPTTNNVDMSVNEAEIDNFLLTEEMEKLNREFQKLKTENEKLKSENSDLKLKVKEIQFSIDNTSDKDINFYTGFSNRKVFNEVLTFLNPGFQGENIKLNFSNYMEETEGQVKRGRPRKLSVENQFFLYLCRVKVGLFEQDLSDRFDISISTVSNIIISWSNFLYQRLGLLNILPSKEQVIEFMPESFKEKYPSTRVII